MLRAVLEFLVVVILAIAARAILKSVLGGIGQASASAFRQTAAEAERRRREATDQSVAAKTLHKDPVCGTYVPESTPYREIASGQTVYFCSENCRAAYTVPR